MTGRSLTAALAVLLAGWQAQAALLQVPGDYTSIQAAVDAALDGDTVLVAEGTYSECVRFRGHNVILASEFLLDGDLDHILATIIDASGAANADTGSCVLIFNGEDSTAAVIGFTLTGGIGTPLFDAPTGATYREGGGILIDQASPRIAFNLITDNEAIDHSGGMRSAGGGGIRTGFGAPVIEHNVFLGNRGHYGAGLVINYAETVARNNVFVHNDGGENFGGAGVWAYGPGHSCVIANNTIVGNISHSGTGAWQGRGGGILAYDTNADIRNNIVWGNHAEGSRPQIAASGSGVVLSYNDVQGGFAGEGNIDTAPGFAEDSGLLLSEASPCIDTGDLEMIWNDPEDPAHSGLALYPAMGTVRNDPGATGGPLSTLLAAFEAHGLFAVSSVVQFGNVTVGQEANAQVIVQSRSTSTIHISEAAFTLYEGSGVTLLETTPLTLAPMENATLHLRWTPQSEGAMVGNLALTHDDPEAHSPLTIDLQGSALSAAVPDQPRGEVHGFYLAPSMPNPFNPTTMVEFGLERPGRATIVVYNTLGQRVRRLASGDYSAGPHRLVFDASSLASGRYYLALSTPGGREVRPIVKTP